MNECLWGVLQQHFVYRVVLECDQIEVFDSDLLAQLVLVRQKIEEHDGLLRFSGVSPAGREALAAGGLEHELIACPDRELAEQARRPAKPR